MISDNKEQNKESELNGGYYHSKIFQFCQISEGFVTNLYVVILSYILITRPEYIFVVILSYILITRPEYIYVVILS